MKEGAVPYSQTIKYLSVSQVSMHYVVTQSRTGCQHSS